MQPCNYFYVLIFFQIFINGMSDKGFLIPKEISSIIVKNCPVDPAQFFLWELPKAEKTDLSNYYKILFFPSTDRVKFIKEKNNDNTSRNVVLDFRLHYLINDVNPNLPLSYYTISFGSDTFERTVFTFADKDRTPFNPSELQFDRQLLLNDSAQDNNGNLWTVVRESPLFLVFYCMTNPKKKKRVYCYNNLTDYRTLCVHHNVSGLEASLMTNTFCDIFKTNETNPHEIPMKQYQLVPEVRGEMTKHASLGCGVFGVLAAQKFYFAYINHKDGTIICKKQHIKEFNDSGDQLKEANIVDFSPNYNPLFYTPGNRTRFIVLLTTSGSLLCMDINQALKGQSILRLLTNISQIEQDGMNLKQMNKISFYNNQISLWSSQTSLDNEVVQVQLPDDWYYYYEVMHGIMPFLSLLRGASSQSVLSIQKYIRRFLSMRDHETKEKSIITLQAYVRMALAKRALGQFKENGLGWRKMIKNVYTYFKNSE